MTSTIYLTELGFYDGLSFHRVIPGFMAQGGCPVGQGTGGPGYDYEGEFAPSARHDRPGLLSMANRGPGTDGSQFFLTFVPTPWLDGNHTIFGEVVDGLETLDALEACGSGSGATSEPLTMKGTLIPPSKIVVLPFLGSNGGVIPGASVPLSAMKKIVVRARTTDVHVPVMALAWMPYSPDSKGRLRPAWS